MSTAAISSNVQVASNIAARKSPTAASPAKAPSSGAAASAPPSNQSSSVAVVNAATAALKEAAETGAQTAQEAAKGDRQAQRLLAKESAAAIAARAPVKGAHVDLKA